MKTRENPAKRRHLPLDHNLYERKSSYGYYLLTFAAGVIISALLFYVLFLNQSEPLPSQSSNISIVKHEPDADAIPRNVMQLLALPDDELEKVDFIELNIAVAREVEGYNHLDYHYYRKIVDSWTAQFLQWLPVVEQEFYQNPPRWENDIHFARLGALAQWLDQAAGVAYVEEQKYTKQVTYTDLGHLLVHGLIDTRRGTCGNMPVLHVAMGRRCGWPVSLACVKAHFICRYDDGKNVYNFETTDTGRGGFAMERDEGFIEEFNLSPRAISSGSDLRSLTARETLAVFIAGRARYYRDTDQWDQADRDYALARTLFPHNRQIYIMAFEQMAARGEKIFSPSEKGHPQAMTNVLYPTPRSFGNTYMPPAPPQNPALDDLMRIYELNRTFSHPQQIPSLAPGITKPGIPPNNNPLRPIRD